MNDRAVSALASPLNNKALADLRNRSFNEDPNNQVPSMNGERTVWYKVASSAVFEEGASKLLDLVTTCFRNEGLRPVSRVLLGAEPEKQYTLSFAFPTDSNEAVNAAVGKINEASRRLQQNIAQDVRGI